MEVNWMEFILIPFALMVVYMIANTLAGSPDPSIAQPGQYGKYVVYVSGSAWLGSLAWRLKSGGTTGYS